MGKIRSIISNDYAGDARLAAFVASVPEIFAAEGDTIFAKRNVVKIFDTGSEAMPRVAVKSYRVPNIFSDIWYSTVGTSKAWRAYHHAFELRSRGIDTPAPVAVIEEYCCGLLRRSFCITEYCELPAVAATLENADGLDMSMARDFAAFVAKMHSLGIVHRDLNSDNVLFSIDGNGERRFTVIDINRMRILPAGQLPEIADCMADLCRFTDNLDLVRRVAEFYIAARGLEGVAPDDFVAMKRRKDRCRRIRRHIFHPLNP